MDKLKAHKTVAWIGVAAAAVALFFLYSFLPLTAPGYGNSPDENANLTFARGFARSGLLYRGDELNIISPGNFFVRSTRVVDSFIVPVGFVGLPVLYGGAAKAAGEAAIPFMTPALALVGLAAWFGLTRRLFGAATASLATGLLALHPLWWYETARTMQPNVLFAALALVAAYLILARPLVGRMPGRLAQVIDAALGGVAFGLALAVRPAEAYWLGAAAVILVALNWRRVRWAGVATTVALAALTLAPFLGLNRSLYGTWLASGYSAVDVAAAGVGGGFGQRLLGPLQPYLFPLGFAPRSALGRFWDFGVAFLPWWSAFVAASLGWLAWRWRRVLRPWREALRRPAGQAAVVSAAVVAWLVLFYGSYEVPDGAAVTLGSSYLRYWLPLAVLSTWPVAWAAWRLAQRTGRAAFALTAFGLLYAAASAGTVFLARPDGLLAVQAELRRYAAIMDELRRLVPANAAVVADQADKYIYPSRMVTQPMRSEHAWQAIEDVRDAAPVYYFGITLPAADFAYLRDAKLAPLGLAPELVATFDHESLYYFKRVNR
jgi:hypothetical protein